MKYILCFILPDQQIHPTTVTMKHVQKYFQFEFNKRIYF